MHRRTRRGGGSPPPPPRFFNWRYSGKKQEILGQTHLISGNLFSFLFFFANACYVYFNYPNTITQICKVKNRCTSPPPPPPPPAICRRKLMEIWSTCKWVRLPLCMKHGYEIHTNHGMRFTASNNQLLFPRSLDHFTIVLLSLCARQNDVNAHVILPGANRSARHMRRTFDTCFTLSLIYHLYVLFVWISYQARYGLKLSYPTIVFTMVIGLLNCGSFIVHILLLGTSKVFTLSVFLPCACVHVLLPGTRRIEIWLLFITNDRWSDKKLKVPSKSSYTCHDVMFGFRTKPFQVCLI